MATLNAVGNSACAYTIEATMFAEEAYERWLLPTTVYIPRDTTTAAVTTPTVVVSTAATYTRSCIKPHDETNMDTTPSAHVFKASLQQTQKRGLYAMSPA